MVCREITKCHGWPQRDAATGIVAAHHTRKVVAAGIQPVNRMAVYIQGLRMFVATQARKRAQTTRHNAHRIERPILNGGHTGVAPFVTGIA